MSRCPSTRAARLRRRRLAVALAVTTGFVVPACTGDDTDGPPGAVAAPGDADAPPGSTTAPTSPLTAPPPETGVPGLDSDDAFCAAWSAFAGSFQVIAVASSFLFDQPLRAFELELAGSVTVTDAYAALADTWPADLEQERVAALDGLFGPFGTRAGRARAALEQQLAGDTDAIAEAWRVALATRNPDDPDVAFAVPPDLAARFAAAVDTFAAAEPPVYADPALVTDVATPATDAYLAANCPDQGLLAGGDVDDA